MEGKLLTSNEHWMVVCFKIEMTTDEEQNKDIEKIQTKYQIPQSLVPSTMMIVKESNGTPFNRLLKVLFDSGNTATMINKQALPKATKPHVLLNPITSKTVEGIFSSDKMVFLESIKLTEFDNNKIIGKQAAILFSGPIFYDVILGQDFLEKAGIMLDFQRKETAWMDRTVQMKPLDYWQETTFSNINRMNDEDVDDDIDHYAAEILDAKYEKVDIDKVVETQKHLSDDKRRKLKRLLSKYE